MVTQLTSKLQSELDNLNSSVRLAISKDMTIKMNFDNWALAEKDDRTVVVNSFLDNEEMELVLIERRIDAGEIRTIDMTKIAVIINSWLSENQNIWQIKNTYNEFYISQKYIDLLTLTVDELLERRWKIEHERIKTQETLFNENLFIAIKKKLHYLVPYFSHDCLLFSNILEIGNENFKSPIIFCNKDSFEIGVIIDNSQIDYSFKTTNISMAMDRILELLPANFEKTKNPLRN